MKDRLHFALLGLLWAASSGSAACDLRYTLQPDYAARQLKVSLELSQPDPVVLALVPEWAGADHARAVLSVDGDHGPLRPAAGGGRARWQLDTRGSATVRYTLQGLDLVGGHEQSEMVRVQLGDAHFQAFGYGLLLIPESLKENQALDVCFDWQVTAGPVFNSHGFAAPQQTQRVRATPVALRHAVYAGGPAWRLLERGLPGGGPLRVAVRGHFPKAPDAAVADDAARLIAAQRRFWQQAADGSSLPPQWLLLTPNHQAGRNQGGTLVTHAAVLHAPQDFSTESDGFQQLVAHENLHQWIPGRFGARGPGGEADVPHYWFSEGFTDFMTHRLLLQSGYWTLARYAHALTQRWRDHLGSEALTMPVGRIAPQFFSNRVAGQQMYRRGEFLAFRWEAQLSAQPGAPSLAALLRRLVLPAGHAHVLTGAQRMVEALVPYLGDGPRRDLQRFLTEGQALTPDDAASGPCLRRELEPVHPWQLGFDRSSFQAMRLRGVDPQGPAYAAGLRDGMALTHYSVYGGDPGRDAEIGIREADGTARRVTYRPVALQPVEMPRWIAIEPPTPACKAWMALQ